ncbi:ribonuclease HII [Halorussus rarus]|uniref:ribonuclease HII n=1 Tax=Halorussus TaxID=1070314 RepID=UPI000E21420F|nr:ribonuclease HII [Halorussus rarus]NHN60174.1 ribonuclease HII [Halorussus sp. JP-T4]
MFGVDEAGKGPVLGSMFAAAVRVPNPDALPEGIADSKRLSPERREELAAEIRADDRVAVGVAEIPVARIDGDDDMNTLTVAAHAEAIAEVVDESAEPLAGIADAGDTSEARFARRVADRVSADLDLTAEHGADDEHAVVGAASVVAKVERDAHVAAVADRYAAEYGAALGDLGSGYPSDPTTREFLESFVAEHGRLPDCARRSWSTCEDVLAEAAQSGLGDF